MDHKRYIYIKVKRANSNSSEKAIICKDVTPVQTAVESAEQNGLYAMVAYLKSLRIADLLKQMQQIDYRENTAIEELEKLTSSVEEVIESNRGGDKGMHGFIGERAQVYIKNAWSIIKGDVKVSELIDDNGMTDYLENGVPIQQKACRANGLLGLDHILEHKGKYPEFNGKYQIPKDFYEKYESLAKLSESEAGRLRRHDLTIWREIQVVKQNNIEVEPMMVTYDEIQRESINNTIENSKTEIKEEAQRQTDIAVESHKPTVNACIQTAAVSSAVEGVLTGGFKVVEKRIEKPFKEFDKQDYKEIGVSTVEGSVKGAVRGTVVYLAENYTPIPGVVAGGAVTVAFDGVKAIKQCSDGKITTSECVTKIGKSAVNASAGALGAKIGGKICPIPVLGEVVGGFLGAYLANKGFEMIPSLWNHEIASGYY